MRITFVLPGVPSDLPVGGFRVIYEHSNLLARRGHEVSIWHLDTPVEEQKQGTIIRKIWRSLYRRYRLSRIDWFELRDEIRITCTHDAYEMPDADVIIATGWQTASAVYEAPDSKGVKVQYVADYEQWLFASQEERARFAREFSLPLYKIAMSEVCAKMARHYCDQAQISIVPVGIDSSVYSTDRSIAKRNEPRVGFAYRTPKYKGIDDAIDALRRVKTQIPDLTVSLFGSSTLQHRLDSWMIYLYRPTHEEVVELYNSVSVFLVSSWAEGWGLPGMEAMACGAALCSTDTGGVNEYAVHEETALISEPRQPHALAGNVIRLLEDPVLRYRIASTGSKSVRSFTWTHATNKLESAIIQALK